MAESAIGGVVDHIGRGRLRRAERLVEEAAKRAGSTIDGLAKALAADPRREELFAQAIEIGQRTTFDAKVAALARALAEAADGTGEIRVQEHVVAALRLLEATDIQVLAWMTRVWDLDLGDPERIEVLGEAEPPEESIIGAGALGKFMPSLGALVPAVSGALVRAGCFEPARNLVFGGGGAYRVSDFGRLVLDYLGGTALDDRV